ncbi:MAG: 16S rRNA (cytosine(1402)-N(4))-methyltransferase RsmH [Clostridiales bacterium]|jgi:16S rRNA (cytosine1402-N4)-methyltransferase|nr:16S rRNA (cytosine(1402)-N(4))-methyltransferase RsmH [Clostridiales bacterium]
MEFRHIPVLCEESVSALEIKPEGVYVDCTLGGGGHASRIAKRLTTGRLIGVDQDQDAVDAAAKTLSNFGRQIIIVRNNFSDIKNILASLNIGKADGFLMDLGISSYQVDNAERGFSYMRNADLDMRMDISNELTASLVVNTYDEARLIKIFSDYGEERYSRRIAKAIIKARSRKPLKTTFELSDLIKSSLPGQSKKGGSHPAKRVFQAIRIEVNGELTVLNSALIDIIELLNPGGRLCVIGYHSLEDRVVKRCFRYWASPCECPPKLPCVCGLKPRIKIVSKKPVIPSAGETANNHRARSAKLRVAEKIDE